MKIIKNVLMTLVPLMALVLMNGCSGGNAGAGDVITMDRPAFISTWKTNNNGVTGDDQILISTNNSGGDFTIDWGDGVVDVNLSNDNTHTYGAAGTYTVKITGNFPRIHFNDTSDSEKLLTIENWGDINWKTMASAFYKCSNLVLNATDVPNLSSVTDMNFMFAYTDAFNADLSDWDTSTVTNMNAVFFLASAFNGDISAWDTSKVTNMSLMFFSAHVFNGDISAWDTSAVTDLSLMFFSAYAFNSDISAWDTSAVTNMYGVFNSATAFNGEVSAWDTSAVTDMDVMFYAASSFTNHDLSVWDVSSNPTHNDFLTLAGPGNTEPFW